MEFILMVVVFAAVILFLPRILKKPKPSELPAEDTIDLTNTFVADSRAVHPLNTQTQIQSKSDSLEKQ